MFSLSCVSIAFISKCSLILTSCILLSTSGLQRGSLNCANKSYLHYSDTFRCQQADIEIEGKFNKEKYVDSPKQALSGSEQYGVYLLTDLGTCQQRSPERFRKHPQWANDWSDMSLTMARQKVDIITNKEAAERQIFCCASNSSWTTWKYRCNALPSRHVLHFEQGVLFSIISIHI